MADRIAAARDDAADRTEFAVAILGKLAEKLRRHGTESSQPMEAPPPDERGIEEFERMRPASRQMFQEMLTHPVNCAAAVVLIMKLLDFLVANSVPGTTWTPSDLQAYWVRYALLHLRTIAISCYNMEWNRVTDKRANESDALLAPLWQTFFGAPISLFKLHQWFTRKPVLVEDEVNLAIAKTLKNAASAAYQELDTDDKSTVGFVFEAGLWYLLFSSGSRFVESYGSADTLALGYMARNDLASSYLDVPDSRAADLIRKELGRNTGLSRDATRFWGRREYVLDAHETLRNEILRNESRLFSETDQYLNSPNEPVNTSRIKLGFPQKWPTNGTTTVAEAKKRGLVIVNATDLTPPSEAEPPAEPLAGPAQPIGPEDTAESRAADDPKPAAANEETWYQFFERGARRTGQTLMVIDRPAPKPPTADDHSKAPVAVPGEYYAVNMPMFETGAHSSAWLSKISDDEPLAVTPEHTYDFLQQYQALDGATRSQMMATLGSREMTDTQFNLNLTLADGNLPRLEVQPKNPANTSEILQSAFTTSLSEDTRLAEVLSFRLSGRSTPTLAVLSYCGITWLWHRKMKSDLAEQYNVNKHRDNLEVKVCADEGEPRKRILCDQYLARAYEIRNLHVPERSHVRTMIEEVDKLIHQEECTARVKPLATPRRIEQLLNVGTRLDKGSPICVYRQHLANIIGLPQLQEACYNNTRDPRGERIDKRTICHISKIPILEGDFYVRYSIAGGLWPYSDVDFDFYDPTVTRAERTRHYAHLGAFQNEFQQSIIDVQKQFETLRREVGISDKQYAAAIADVACDKLLGRRQRPPSAPQVGVLDSSLSYVKKLFGATPPPQTTYDRARAFIERQTQQFVRNETAPDNFWACLVAQTMGGFQAHAT